MNKLLLAAAFAMTAASAHAEVINFDDQGLTGPSVFASTTPQDLFLTFGGVDVSIIGGTILDNTSFLPGNTSAVYGTADFFSGGLNPLVITFSQAINNFFLDIYNGNTAPVTYVVSDNNGNSTSVTLPSNLDGGTAQVGFAATGTEVSILALLPSTPTCCEFDFFIDNITFNEPLPPNLAAVPLPAGLPMLAGGIVLLGLLRRKRAA